MSDVTNAPGLSAIAYRIGTFATFRAAMLDEVARPDLLAPFPDASGTVAPNPFATWQPGTAGDYHTALIELWAYLADILTFYQERIANEAYLPTATSRDSLVRLAQLVGYVAAPGAAARTLVAFTLGPNATATIPAGTRVATRAAGGAPPVVFETASALVAKTAWNAIPLSPVAVANQFAALSSFQTIFVRSQIRVLPRIEVILGSFRDIFGDFRIDLSSAVYSSVGAWLRRDALVTTAEDVGSRTVVLDGVSLRLVAGDMVMTVQNEGTGNEILAAYVLTNVAVDTTARTTSITWDEPAGTAYANSPVAVSVFALRVAAGFFGNDAPLWQSIAPVLNNQNLNNNANTYAASYPNAPYAETNWDDPTNPVSHLPFDPYSPLAPDPILLYLDARYPALAASATQPDRAYLIDRNAPSNAQYVHLVDVQDVSVTGFATTAKVSRVTLDQALNQTLTFAVRTTTLYAGAERLPLHNALPLPDPVAGAALVLSGLVGDLSDGQTVIVRGEGYDVTQGGPTGTVLSEVATLSGAPATDPVNGLTLVTLATSLANTYTRATTVLLANAVLASQGQTVRGEPLGTGDGTADQRYPLAKAPLTYLPSADVDLADSVSSTLSVTVNGILWSETPNVDLAGPAATVYEIDRPPDGSAAVAFGDGTSGARPPSGAVLRATYRQGIGTSGNVASGAIANLLDRPLGVTGATNPLPAAGGVDPETAAGLQADAPARMRTFGRAVALADLAAFAQTYPGIAKAAASWQTLDALGRAIPRPYVQLTVATADLVPLADHAPPLRPLLRAFLDARRDPNVPLRIVDAQPVPLLVIATLDVLPSFGRNATLLAAQAALGIGSPAGGFFALARRQFGDTIALSSLYALLQGVPGVSDVVISAFPASGAPVQAQVSVNPTQLPILDPASTLALGSGGYVDS